jgi:hypothetical protein
VGFVALLAAVLAIVFFVASRPKRTAEVDLEGLKDALLNTASASRDKPE